MNPIDVYLDSVFSSLPATTEAIKARADIRTLMVDKYEELTAQGISAEDAHKQIIDDFGDISEVAYALGLGEFVDGNNPVENNALYMDEERAQAYIEHRKNRGMKIGLGVGLFGLFFSLLDGFITYYNIKNHLPSDNAEFNNALYDVTFSILFVVVLGLSLYLFIHNPYSQEKHFVRKMPLALTHETQNSVRTARQQRTTIQTLRLVIGIILIVGTILIGSTLRLSFDMSINDSSNGDNLYSASPLLNSFTPITAGIIDFTSIALLFAGIYLLIIRGVEKNAYMALLKEGKFARKNAIK